MALAAGPASVRVGLEVWDCGLPPIRRGAEGGRSRLDGGVLLEAARQIHR
jgi:hypothetical protein